MRAILSNYRQAPRKVRLVADTIRGKQVTDALAQLRFLDKRASLPVKKLLESAVANAKSAGIDTSSLFVKGIEVNGGVTLKRSMPRARGRAFPILKRTSHITLTLAQNAKPAKTKVSKAKTLNPKP